MRLSCSTETVVWQLSLDNEEKRRQLRNAEQRGWQSLIIIRFRGENN